MRTQPAPNGRVARALAAALVLVCAIAFPAPAQQNIAIAAGPVAPAAGQADEKDAIIAGLVETLETMKARPAAPGPQFDERQRELLSDAQLRSWITYYESQQSLNRNGDRLREYQQRAFAWQLSAGNWLLAVVIIISLSGVAFAGYEMINARRLMATSIEARKAALMLETERLRAGGAAAGGGPTAQLPDIAALPTTILIEPSKIQITSAVIGIVILTLSLGFQYLFLTTVYGIDVIDMTGTGKAVVKAEAPAQEQQQAPKP